MTKTEKPTNGKDHGRIDLRAEHDFNIEFDRLRISVRSSVTVAIVLVAGLAALLSLLLRLGVL